VKLSTATACPTCGAEMVFDWETQELPYFGEAMIVTGNCSCGFRHADTILLSSKEPSRYTMPVESLEDLDARVVRSSSCTVRVPEIGVDIEPGCASESYITNVEGILDRIQGIVEFATRTAREAEDPDRTKRGEEIIETIELVRLGKSRITLVLEDPLGNSAIASEKAVYTTLTEEEIASLKTGMVVLDL
jgi:zinc finger protein